MANAVAKKASPHNQTVIFILGLLSLLLLIQKNDAYEFKVGGSGDWSLASTNYNYWAERNRFQIGDTVLFNYQAKKDSVFEVSKDDYNNCNTKSPIKKHNSGHTVIKLKTPGPHYFISGVEEQCKKNEKVMILVMADRNKKPASNSPNGVSSSMVMSLLCSIGAFGFSLFF